MLDSFVKRSFTHLLLTGIAGILTGLLAIIWPGITLVVIAIIWGAYALAEGIVQIYAAFKLGKSVRGPLLFSGILGIIFGVIVLFNPDIGIVVIAWMLGFWMILRAIEEFSAAFDKGTETSERVLYGLVGVLYIAAAIVFFAAPGLSAAVVAMWLGFLALFTGIFLIVLAFRVRKHGEEVLEQYDVQDPAEASTNN